MEKDSIKSLPEQVTREIQEEKLKMACAYSTLSVESPPVLTREEMVPYKHVRNLAELPLGSTHTVTAIGYIDHYRQEKLVVELDDGILYQAGEYLEEKKEKLKDMCKIVIFKTKLSETRKKFAVCKIVQHGDWAGVLDYDEVPLHCYLQRRNEVRLKC